MEPRARTVPRFAKDSDGLPTCYVSWVDAERELRRLLEELVVITTSLTADYLV
jgi:hypothetical protein